jgi:hypothetical protein
MRKADYELLKMDLERLKMINEDMQRMINHLVERISKYEQPFQGDVTFQIREKDLTAILTKQEKRRMLV